MGARVLTCAMLAVVWLVGCSTNDRLTGDAGRDQAAGADGIVQGALPDYEHSSPEYFTHHIGDRVFFEVDQSSITPDAAEILRLQAEWLRTNSSYQITVEGHADEQGTREYNLALGARRASSVKSFLVQLGVPEGRISTVTYGKERPVAACSNESCWSQNRRAVTLINRELTS